MATVKLYHPTGPTIASSEHHGSHVWNDLFGGAQRQQLLADDLEAGRKVSAVLISVVGAGLLAMIGTVLYCVL